MYQTLLNKLKEQVSKAKAQRRDITVLVIKELDNLSDKQIQAIYHRNMWLIEPDEMVTGNIADITKNKLKSLLITDLSV